MKYCCTELKSDIHFTYAELTHQTGWFIEGTDMKGRKYLVELIQYCPFCGSKLDAK